MHARREHDIAVLIRRHGARLRVRYRAGGYQEKHHYLCSSMHAQGVCGQPLACQVLQVHRARDGVEEAGKLACGAAGRRVAQRSAPTAHRRRRPLHCRRRARRAAHVQRRVRLPVRLLLLRVLRAGRGRGAAVVGVGLSIAAAAELHRALHDAARRHDAQPLRHRRLPGAGRRETTGCAGSLGELFSYLFVKQAGMGRLLPGSMHKYSTKTITQADGSL